jgi:DNA-directed RNA polymerase subunit H (RpoH/RPB5)
MSSVAQVFKSFKLIHRSREHILDMLKFRGYNVDKFENYTDKEIISMIKSHTAGKFETKFDVGPLDLLLTKKKEDGNEKEKIYVKYRLDDKFKTTENLKAQINDIYSYILDPDDTLIILNVCRILPKPNTKDKTDDEFVKSFYLTKGYFIQIFGLENFLFNPNRNTAVPEHRVLTKAELIEVVKQYNITNLRNLPLIKRSEAQAKYIGLRPKQVCKIIQKNKTSGVSYAYRICTN